MLSRYFHTVRHLEPVQVTDRIRRRLRPLRSIPEVPSACALRPRDPAPPAAPDDHGYDGSSFRILDRRVGFEGADRWSAPGVDRLRAYNLHYFRYLPALDPARAAQLVHDWIRHHRDPLGVGWEPYPLSLRIREWIEWLQDEPNRTVPGRPDILRSLAEQTAALEAQIEYHLLGNHLLENAITLCWAGLSIDSPLSPAWVRAGRAILERETARQILPDGTHDERSPMYQALLAESLLRLTEVAGRIPGHEASRIEDLARGAGNALARTLPLLAHPDGELALLNDTAHGVAPTVADLRGRFGAEIVPAAGRAARAWSLPSCGILGHRDDPGITLLLDAGPIGPDHQPGHGHAGALGFEMSLGGRRIVTDTGVSTYEPGAERSHARSTRAHSTVEVDGRDQSEVWGAFRCARRIRPGRASSEDVEGGTRFEGSYRGPGRSRGGVRHVRGCVVTRDRCEFLDRVLSPGAHEASVRIHLHPDVRVERSGAGWDLLLDGGAVASVISPDLAWSLESSPYHPRFGTTMDRACLRSSTTFRDAAEARWTIVVRVGRSS